MQTTNQKGIVKLTKAQYNTLVTTGSVTDGAGNTFTYQDGYIYCTDEVEYVSFAEPQLLTPEQQAQARANIGAGSGSGGTEVYVNGVLQSTLSFDSDPQTQISAKVPTSRTIAGVDLVDNITKSELLTALNVEDGAEVNEVNDIEIDDVSCVTGTTAEIRTINGDYNASTNRLATESDTVPTLKGSGAPTTSTVGKEGQLYLDTTNNKTYQCVGIIEDTSTNPSTFTYTWTKLIRGTDYATTGSAGIVQLDAYCGIANPSGSPGGIGIVRAQNDEIDARVNGYKPIVPSNLNYAVKSALTDANHLTMTSAEQAVAQSVLGISGGGSVDIDEITITENSSNKIQAVGITNGTTPILYNDIYAAITTTWEV